MSISNMIITEIKNLPGIEDCPPQKVARFLPHVTSLKLEKNEVLFNSGENAKKIYFIIDGVCQLTTKDRQPFEIKSGYIGEEAAIGLPYYIGDCTAKTPVNIMIFPAEAIKSLINHLPILQSIQISFSDKLSKNSIEDLSKKHEESKIKKTENPKQRAEKGLLGWLMTLLVPILIFFGLNSIENPPDESIIYLLSILSISITMWVFSLTSDFIPAILAILCILLTGLAPPEIVLKGFSDNSFFMALSIFALSAVIMISGLSYRILLWLLNIGPSHKAWYSLSLFLTGQVLTPLIPTTNGRVAIVAPFLKELLGAFDHDSARKEAPRLTASLLAGVSLLSAVFLTSKSINFVIFGLLPAQEQTRFQWLFWVYSASVCGLILFIGYLLAAWLMFRNDSRPTISKDMVRAQLTLLGPLTRAEWACLVGMGTLFLSFLTASQHHIAIPWVALTIMFGLLLFGFLSRDDFRRRIDWGFLVFLGSLIGVVATMHHVGMDRYLSIKLAWLGHYMDESFELFILILAATIFFVRLLLPINATIIVFATLLMPFALNSGINPWVVGFTILLLAESFIWPYQASYYLQFLSIAGSRSQGEHPKILLFNMVMFLVKLAAIYLSLPFWRSLGVL